MFTLYTMNVGGSVTTQSGSLHKTDVLMWLENKTYLHIWPPGPSVPTWSWHSVHTSEALWRYGPTTERRTVTGISDEEQWQSRGRTAGHLLHGHLIRLPNRPGRPVGAAILNEAEDEDFLCVEEDGSSHRPSNWQYCGGCNDDSKQGRLYCHPGTVGFDISPGWKAQVVREICHGNNRRPPFVCRHHRSPPGNNSSANQGKPLGARASHNSPGSSARCQ